MNNYIFCDESCHLPKDHKENMILGAIKVSKDHRFRIYKNIRGIKEKHGLNPNTFEIKWSKISASKLDFYKDLVRYFFTEDELSIRILIATGKQSLDHNNFQQSHDDWYFKMYYLLLSPFFGLQGDSGVFIDIKDTNSAGRVKKLKEIISRKSNSISRIQITESHKSELIQLVDLFVGATSYMVNQQGELRKSKEELIMLIQSLSGVNLRESTSKNRPKMDIFYWKPTQQISEGN